MSPLFSCIATICASSYAPFFLFFSPPICCLNIEMIYKTVSCRSAMHLVRRGTDRRAPFPAKVKRMPCKSRERRSAAYIQMKMIVSNKMRYGGGVGGMGRAEASGKEGKVPGKIQMYSMLEPLLLIQMVMESLGKRKKKGGREKEEGGVVMWDIMWEDVGRRLEILFWRFGSLEGRAKINTAHKPSIVKLYCHQP
jgi:hypothetical protein